MGWHGTRRSCGRFMVRQGGSPRPKGAAKDKDKDEATPEKAAVKDEDQAATSDNKADEHRKAIERALQKKGFLRETLALKPKEVADNNVDAHSVRSICCRHA